MIDTGEDVEVSFQEASGSIALLGVGGLGDGDINSFTELQSVINVDLM